MLTCSCTARHLLSVKQHTARRINYSGWELMSGPSALRCTNMKNTVCTHEQAATWMWTKAAWPNRNNTHSSFVTLLVTSVIFVNTVKKIYFHTYYISYQIFFLYITFLHKYYSYWWLSLVLFQRNIFTFTKVWLWSNLPPGMSLSGWVALWVM